MTILSADTDWERMIENLSPEVQAEIRRFAEEIENLERGLAEALTELLTNGFKDTSEIQDLSIKISGCMNSCGQHHIADIGFYGASSEVGGHAVPQYIVLIGGRTEPDRAEFGKPVARIPTRRAPEVVRRLLSIYRDEWQGEESFRHFIDRIGLARIKEALAPLAIVPLFEEAPELYGDLGTEGEVFKAEVGPGECAA